MLSVTVPEVAGSFRALIGHIEPRNVTEFSYRAGDPSKASIYLSFQAAGASADKRAGDAEEVIGSLRNAGMDVTNLRDNELAKVRTHAALRCPPLLHVHLCLLL